jgi:hypothetical protein
LFQVPLVILDPPKVTGSSVVKSLNEFIHYLILSLAKP